MDTDVHKCSDYMDDDDQRSGRIEYDITLSSLLAIIKYRAFLSLLQ